MKLLTSCVKPFGDVSTAFIKQYDDILRMKVQQKSSVLEGTVDIDYDFTGEYKFYDLLGKTSMVEKTTRHQDTPVIDPDHDKRRISKRTFLHNVLLDEDDELNMLLDPRGKYAENAAAAVGRKKDELILAALNGTAYYGKEGASSIALSAFTNTWGDGHVIAHGSAGLTKAKVLSARTLLALSLSSNEEYRRLRKYFVCTEREIEDLLDLEVATSRDYVKLESLQAGEVDAWMGFIWKITNEVTRSSSVDNCFAYLEKAVTLGLSQAMKTRISERADKNYSTQVHTTLTGDAVRMEEEMVVQVNCYNA